MRKEPGAKAELELFLGQGHLSTEDGVGWAAHGAM